MTDTPPAAPTDREAALLAEVALLRDMLADIAVWTGYVPMSGIAKDRMHATQQRLHDILARPPGAAGQALLDAADRLALFVQERGESIHRWNDHRGDERQCAMDSCRSYRERVDAYRHARSGAPSAAAPGGQS